MRIYVLYIYIYISYSCVVEILLQKYIMCRLKILFGVCGLCETQWARRDRMDEQPSPLGSPQTCTYDGGTCILPSILIIYFASIYIYIEREEAQLSNLLVCLDD